MNIMDVIKKRKSARSFLPKPISDDLLLEILEAGRWAPSGGNGQNCYFGVVRDEQKKKQLAAAAGNQQWIATAPIVLAYCSYVGYDRAKLPEDDFGLIVDQTRFGKDFIHYLNQYEDRRAVGLLWENGCPLIPGEHIFLAAASYGLSACWIGYLDINKASEILNLPEDMACLFLMPIGYPMEEPEESHRKSLEEIVFYDGWSGKI